MTVTDLHTLDISKALRATFASGAKMPGAVLSLVPETPTINIGKNVPLVMGGRAKGALVDEGGKKPDNGRKLEPKPFVTKKLVYSQRFSDEFMQWSKKEQADFVSELCSDITQKSVPRDLDTIVIHGYDPHSNTQSETLSDYITKTGSSILVPKTGDDATALDTDLASAVKALEGQDINGIAASPEAVSQLSTIVVGGKAKYPEAGVFGLVGNTLAGKRAASTPEVGAINETKFVIGDWSMLKLGFAGDATWKVIEYGNPDGGEADLQEVNQILIRYELFFGFRVLDPKAFAVVAKSQD